MSDLGWALQKIRGGVSVCRAGWNGRNQYLGLLQPAAPLTKPFVALRSTDGHIQPWVCSASDLLATDWEVATIAPKSPNDVVADQLPPPNWLGSLNSFVRAMHRCSRGYWVRRAAWAKGITLHRSPAGMVMALAEGVPQPWLPQPEDIEADDWLLATRKGEPLPVAHHFDDPVGDR